MSGAHFNPAVTLGFAAVDRMAAGLAAAYIAAQVAGGIVGVILANLMFDLPAVEWSTTERSGSNLWLSEVIATFGLLMVIFGLVRAKRESLVAPAVAAYIAAAYFFTSSTSFANPAVTVAGCSATRSPASSRRPPPLSSSPSSWGRSSWSVSSCGCGAPLKNPTAPRVGRL